VGHILIIEDEPDIAEYFARYLEGCGHRCDVASDGARGSTLVFDGTNEYDLVLCDLKMPQMGGKDFLESAHPILRDKTPVIVVSGWPHLVEALGVARRWAFMILNKPVELGELKEAVERGLEQRALYLQVRELEMRVQRLVANKDVLLEQRQALYDEVRVDAMTELPNRRRLEEELDIHNANVGRYRTRFAVAFCDLDDFGRFNNEQSYGVGDAVLRAVSQRLRNACRRGDTVYRYGGDEFVIVLAYQDLDEACRAADRFRVDLDARDLELGEGLGAVRVTVSGGVVAVTPEEQRPVSDLLDEASRLCKGAKAAGGNRVHPCSLTS
jgi:diguanylate cyclase (GGDEF)-like protein